MRTIESGTIELTFDAGAPVSADLMALKHWDNDAAELVDNFEQAIGWYAVSREPSTMAPPVSMMAEAEPSYPAASFVIVTTADIVAGSGMLDSYVAMKQQLGWTVYVATEADWGGGTGDVASENIRDWLQANYAAMGIQYVMLVGNPDPGIGDVPMKLTYPEGPNADDYHRGPTDYYYADLTSNWNTDGDTYYGEWGDDLGSTKPIHEVLVGRIPVYHADYATLDSILNKTMVYQSEDDTAWRQSLLMPMAVSNYENEDAYFPDVADGVGVARELSAVAQANGFDTFTLYEKEGLLPTPEPSDLPLNRDNLVEHWSSSPTGLVTWRAHGSATSASRKIWALDTDSDGVPEKNEITWARFIRSSDAELLNNTQPSIVFEASCLNAYPEHPENLAYSLLSNGAVGTFASTRVTDRVAMRYEPWHDQYGVSQAYAFHVTANLMQQPSTETLASSLQWARENLGTRLVGRQAWRNCVNINLYGDPTVTLTNPVSTPGTVFGNVWEDINGDGSLDPHETGAIAGATVFVDSNGNGLFDFGESFTVSDTQGRYALGGLADGEYTVSISLPLGYTNSGIVSQNVTIVDGVDQQDVDFSGFASRSIIGSVVLDLNENEIRDTGELGLADVTVVLDAVLDQYDAVATTDADGYFSFDALPQGPYTISHEVPAGCETVGDLQRSVTVNDALVVKVDLPDRLLPALSGTLSGYCWYDVDADGTWDQSAESGMNGRTVFLDLNTNGSLDEGEPWALTGDHEGDPGHYQFSSLEPGRYAVGVVPLDGWTRTAPAPSVYTIDLVIGSGRTGLDFGGAFEYFDSILVSTDDDGDNGDLSFGDLSFREALRVARERDGTDTIRFAPSLTGQTIEIDPVFGTFAIDSDVEIVGLVDLSQTPSFDERTVLDGLDACTVVRIAEGVAVSMQSLTITGGNATETIEVSGELSLLGGGIHVGSGASLTLAASLIINNRSDDLAGGIGVAATGNLTVRHCRIASNTAAYQGGGIYAYKEAVVTIENTEVDSNVAEVKGGGISVWHDDAAFSISGSIISNNSALVGGGIRLRSIAETDDIGESVISHCIITDNSAITYGAGIELAWTNAGVLVIDCTINMNHVAGSDQYVGVGGGVVVIDGQITLEHTTIADNSAGSTNHASGVIRWQTDEEDDRLTAYEFTVAVSDGDVTAQESFEVYVDEVNQAPVLAAVGNWTVDEETLLSFSATATDADLPTDTLSFSLTGDVPEGAEITWDGHFTWTPSEDQGPSEYAFTVQVQDGSLQFEGRMDTEEITVTVNGVNDPPGPIANADVYATTENTVLQVEADTGVLANDLEDRGRAMLAVLVSSTMYGDLTLEQDGSFRYVPKQNFNREDRFVYKADDGSYESDLAEVVITVSTSYPRHNGQNPLDVDDNGQILPTDALWIINDLDRNGIHECSQPRPRPLSQPFFDTNRDNWLTPVDALIIINHLQRSVTGEGEMTDAVPSVKTETGSTAASHAVGWIDDVETVGATSKTRSKDHHLPDDGESTGRDNAVWTGIDRPGLIAMQPELVEEIYFELETYFERTGTRYHPLSSKEMTEALPEDLIEWLDR